MIDFKLNNIGDIDIALANQYPSFSIDFYIPDGNTKYDSFRIDIDTDILKYNTDVSGCRIDFTTDLRQDNVFPVGTPPVFDNPELAQEVWIRLKTELEEFEFLPGMGSKIVLERHNDIRSTVTLENVKQYVIEAISDVIFPEEYEVTVERIDDDSRFRYETLRITIDTGKTKIYDAEL